MVLMDYVIIIAFVGVIITFCVYKIARDLRTAFAHAATQSLQWRIFVLLLLQLIVPLVFCALPANLLMVSALFGYDIADIQEYITILYASSPVIEPILIFSFIKKYQMTVRTIFCGNMIYAARNSSRTAGLNTQFTSRINE